MIPFPVSLPAPKAESEKPLAPAPVRAPAPGSLAALIAHIKRERADRLRAQEIARQRSAAPRRMRPWEMVGLFAGAIIAASYLLPSEPAPTTAADKVPYGIARGVAKIRAYGCPTKEHIQQMRDLIARGPNGVGVIAMMMFGDKHCTRFVPGDAVVIDQHFPWDAMYLARRPGDSVQMWFAEGVIDRVKP